MPYDDFMCPTSGWQCGAVAAAVAVAVAAFAAALADVCLRIFLPGSYAACEHAVSAVEAVLLLMWLL